jgi:hypothetical protein
MPPELDYSGLTPAAPPQVPPSAAAEAQTPALDFSGLKPLDYSGLQPMKPPAPADTGILAAPFAGMLSASRDVGQTGTTIAGAFTGEKPTPLPAENTVAAQPPELSDIWRPKQLAEKALYQFGKNFPGLTGAVAGGVAGEAIAGPPGALAGGGLGMFFGTAFRELGPEFAQALQENPKDPNAAFHTAVTRTATQAGVAGVSWDLFGWQPFSGTVKNMLFQAFGVQPAVTAGGTAVENVVEGRPAGQGVAESVPGAVVGTLTPMAGHAALPYASAAVRRLFGAAAPTQAPGAAPGTPGATPGAPSPGGPGAGSTVPPDTMPPPGTTVNVQGLDQPFTVKGYRNGLVDLDDPDGKSRVMKADEFARLHTVIQPASTPATPTAEGQRLLPPPETVQVPGQPWTSTGEGLIPGTPGAVMRPSEGAPAATQTPTTRMATPEEMGQPPTLNDIDRWATEEHAAQASGENPTPAEQVTSPVEQAVEAATKPAADMLALPAPRRMLPKPTTTYGEGFTAQPPGPLDAMSILKARIAAGRAPESVAPVPITPSPTPTEVPTAPEEPRVTVERPAPTPQSVEVPATPAAPETQPPITAPAPPETPEVHPAGTEPTDERLPIRTIRDQVDQAFIPSTGAGFSVQYGIVDAHDLVTSNHDDLSPNSAYPQGLQPRQRERAESEAQIASILNGGNEGKFRPELLGETPDAANGAPIVGPDGLVEGGNARTMALRRAYDRGLPQADEYRNYLAAQGYPIEGIRSPMLVRVNRGDMEMPQREQLARDLNVPAVAAMSASEQAMADAQQIKPEALRSYQGGDVFSAANQPFVTGLLRSFTRPTDLPALTNPEGGLSQVGRRRVLGALLAKAYGDSGIVAALTEDADNNVKAIGNALTDAAPAWTQMRDAVASGRVPAEYDLTSPLLEAVRLISHARDEGRNVAEFVNQRGLFGEGVSPETEGILAWMLGAPDWTRRYGREKIADALTEYARAAQREPGMLGGTRPAPSELTEQARERAQGATKDLFAAPVGEPRGAAPVRAGVTEGRSEGQGQRPDQAGLGAPAGGAGEPKEIGRDISTERLRDISGAFGEHVKTWSKKSLNAPLTATETGVLSKIPDDGLDLGFISKPLIYSKSLRGFSRPEKSALYSLIDRGTLRVERFMRPDREMIVRALLTDSDRAALGRTQAPSSLLREGEPGLTTSPGEYRNLAEDWLAYRRNTGFPAGAEGSHLAARAYVRDRGSGTGFEHVAVFDPDFDGVTRAGTSGMPDYVALPEGVADLPGVRVIHHNHPLALGPSGHDVAALGWPGIGRVLAHTHDQDVFDVRLTPSALAWRDRTNDPEASAAAIRAVYLAADRVVNQALKAQQRLGKIDAYDHDMLQADLTNRALDAAGLTHYLSSRPSDPLSGVVQRSILRRAAESAAGNARRYGLSLKSGDALDAGLDRSALVSGPDEIMAGLSRPNAESAGEPGSEIRGPGSEEGAVGAPEGEPAMVAPRPFTEPRAAAQSVSGLAEKRPQETLDDYIDRATSDAVERILGPPGKPPSPPMVDRALRALGVGPRQPGRPERWFNFVNRYTTTPANAARYDFGGVSRQKYQAEQAKSDRAAELANDYITRLGDWARLNPEDHQAVNAALELERLQGITTPLDGRSIVVENRGHPLAQNSRLGEIVALDTPARIQAYAAYRRATDKMYSDLVAAIARSHGWTGPPTAAAIGEAASAATSPAERKRLERVAKIVGLTEYARRTAYTPFMRIGDYYFSVTPKAGTPPQPGVAGWDGEGYAPTAWYSRIDSRLPEEKLMGGTRQTSPTVDAHRAELQKTFPDDRYNISEGYYHPTDLKGMDVSSVEDLFQAIGRDFRREWRDRIRTSPDPEAMKTAMEQAEELHNQAIDALLNQFYENLKAGFKRESLNIPGYIPDLTQTTGIHASWMSHHIANLENRDAIAEADRKVDQSYDPRARAMWHAYDRDMDHNEDDTGFNWGINRLKQAAFYYALGGNVASTARIMMHAPMLGWPTLSLGLNPAKVGATYLGAMKDVLKTVRANIKEGATASLLGAANTPDERALLERAEATGLTHSKGREALGAITQHGAEAYSPQKTFARQVLDVWSSNIAVADRLIRGAMLLAAYRTAKQSGAMDTINRVWSRGDELWKNDPTVSQERDLAARISDLVKKPSKTEFDKEELAKAQEQLAAARAAQPAAFARFMVDRSAGLWGRANQSQVQRHPLGGAALQFRGYEMNLMSTLHQMAWHMGPPGKAVAAMMLGGIGAMAGVLGLPFMQDIEDAYEGIYKFIAHTDPNLNEKFMEFMRDDPMGWGASAGRAFLYGMQPLGVDMSSMSFGNLAGRANEGPMGLFGAGISMPISAGQRAIERYNSEQSWLAVAAEPMPNGIKHVVNALGVYPDQGIRSASGNVIVPPAKITGGEQAELAAGFEPASMANVSREDERDYRLREAQTAKAQGFNTQVKGLSANIAQSEARGDYAQANEFRQELAKVIQAAAAASVKVAPKTIGSAELQATQPEARQMQLAPKAVRGQVVQPMYTQP